jgi:rRNA small subunit pseudouridine methyltransferase Nep1
MLNFVFAEAALEIIPKEISSHPSIIAWAKSSGKKTHRALLDRSYHHWAMNSLDNCLKRGRPDIVHFSLLEALGTPLNREGLLRTYIHTIGDQLIFINPTVRLPRNYNRFVGLIEQLFRKMKVPKQGQMLLNIRKGTLSDLLETINPSYTLLFSRSGSPQTLHEVLEMIVEIENPLVIVGAFSEGNFSEETRKIATKCVSIDSETLDAWMVTARIIYEYERILDLPKNRLLRKQ